MIVLEKEVINFFFYFYFFLLLVQYSENNLFNFSSIHNSGLENIVKILIQHGANVNIGEWTPLHAAAEDGNWTKCHSKSIFQFEKFIIKVMRVWYDYSSKTVPM